MNSESGWEKGSVENKVGYVQLNFLVSPPHFTNRANFNKELLAEAAWDIAFDSVRYMAVLTDKWERFTLELGRHEYSVSPEYTCVNVWLKITATQVKFMDMQQYMWTCSSTDRGSILKVLVRKCKSP